MPRSRSPQGIQLDSPPPTVDDPVLEREDAAKRGDGPRRRLLLETRDEPERAGFDLEHARNLLQGVEPGSERLALLVGHARRIPERHRLRSHRLLLDGVRALDDVATRLEHDAGRRRVEALLRWILRVAGDA